MRSTVSLGACLALAAVLPLLSCGHGLQARAPVAVRAATARVASPSMSARDLDAMLERTWTEKGVTPSAPADDATFLRRAWIDVVGTIPPPEKVAAYTADKSPDKREKLVDELLASAAYAEHWADYWEDELLGQTRAADIDRLALRVWLRDEIRKNVPWKDMVFALLTATGENTPGGPRAATTSEAERAIAKSADPINGAVNYVLKYRDAPQDWAGSASKTFLGVQIQCAQCHDHKTEKWTQEDFRRFAACFLRAQTLPLDAPMAKTIRRVLVRDIDRPLPRFMKDADLQPIGRAAPTALDGTPMSGDVRESIATWMTRSPWLADEMVNRMWGHFLGRGFVDPVDDLRPSNPADAPEIEAALAKDFAAHGYDVKRLIRTIALSRAYGLSTAPSASQDPKRPPVLWSRFRATPLGPNELLDALIDATGVDDALRRLGRFDVEALTERLRTLYGFVFDVDEESDRPSYEGTITQALVQLNGRLVAGGSTALPGTTVARVARSDMSDAQKVSALYVQTLSREPTSEELATWIAYLAHPPASRPAAKPRAQLGPGPFRKLRETREPKVAAVEDLMWTLLNSSEFVLNH